MGVNHPELLVAAVPSNRLDQIVDILTGSVSVGAATGGGGAPITSANASAIRTAVSPDYYYTKGLWSFDGGGSWLEMGNAIPVNVDSVVGLLTLTVNSTSSSSKDATPNSILVNVTNQNVATGYTILYKVLVMARYDQEMIGLKALSQPLRYSSKNKYMKVAFEGSVLLPTAGTTVIAHNLGYIPNINTWVLFDDTPYAATEQYMSQALGASITVDTQNLYIDYHSFAGAADEKMYYRIYLNA